LFRRISGAGLDHFDLLRRKLQEMNRAGEQEEAKHHVHQQVIEVEGDKLGIVGGNQHD
jgi:hypothetical protein